MIVLIAFRLCLQTDYSFHFVSFVVASSPFAVTALLCFIVVLYSDTLAYSFVKKCCIGSNRIEFDCYVHNINITVMAMAALLQKKIAML